MIAATQSFISFLSLVNSLPLHPVCAYHVCTVDERLPGPLLWVVYASDP